MFKNLNITRFVYAVVILSAFFWYGLAFFSGKDISKLWDFVKLIPNVVTADLVALFVFTKWGWKWRIFRKWLVPFPDLNGTWKGQINTTWVDPKTDKRPAPIPVILTIKQSFTNVSCVMRTAEMTSYSYAEDFKLDNEKQIKQLVYSYTSMPNVKVTERSPAHNGTIILDMMGTPVKKLKGYYWTARKTTGEVELTFWKKVLLDELPNNLKEHPMSDAG